VKTWFQAFAFKWVNLLHRGGETLKAIEAEAEATAVGLCMLNQVDP
jgi:hypothetical protein